MKSIKWIYNNSLFLITLFLFVFIPLYPKLPVIGVSHTWVYIRAEDFLVAFAGLVFISLLLTKKVTLKTPLTIPIFLFWLVGAVSTLFAISYIFPNLANVFPNVALFHYFRRIEYLSLFFIGFFAIRSKKQIPTVVFVLAITLIAVFIYGLGQRLWEFPAYLTMNEEFAKGIPLKLSAASRIPSTFAGHYDLAAYLVMLIPIVGSMIFGFKKLYIKIFLLLSALSGLILLFMTASRVSFAVYLVTTTFLLIIQKQKKYIIPVVVVSIMLMSSFQGISQRFASTITEVDLVVDARSGKAVGISKGTDKTGKILIEEKQSTGESLPQGSGFISAPSKQGSSANKISYKRTKIQAGQEITEVTDMEGNFVIKKALAYDVSFTTRFQGQWPRATEAFDRSMLLGSGYSSISLATDNNYLRILGEIGIIGAASFFLIFLIFAIYVKKVLPLVDSLLARSFILGVSAALFGIGLNAILIDVFEASKVAFVLWLLIGVSLGILSLFKKKDIKYLSEIKKIAFSYPAIAIYIFAFVVWAFSMIMTNYFVADDFTWLRWVADCKKIIEPSGFVHCESAKTTIVNYFKDSGGFFYRPGTKAYFYFMYSFFWLNPAVYHFSSILFHFGVSLLVFLVSAKILKNKLFAFAAAVIFSTLAVHFESVFWVSATGHVMSAFFILLALYLFMLARERKNYILYTLSFVVSLIAPLFYELGIVAPILILSYGLLELKNYKMRALRNNLKLLLFLIPIPLYLIARAYSNSHWLSGDYSYSFNNFIFNTFGNLGGYGLISILGPDFLPYYLEGRIFGRSNVLLTSLALVVFLALLVILYKKVSSKIYTEDKKIIIFSLLLFVVGLLPFIGFGNISPRYAYLAAFGLVLLFVLMLSKLFRFVSRKNKKAAFILLFVILFSVISYNLSILKRINKDWKYAGNVSNNLMLGFSSTFAKNPNLPNNPVFYFTNVPIRYGQAWIFPVGLPDALWFTLQNENLNVHTVESLDVAWSLAEGSTSAKVFEFTNLGEVEEVVKTRSEE